MTIISDEVLKVISEHTTRDRSGFDVLRKRFESTNNYSPSAAAAIGYLIAKDELDVAKEEEEPDVYDEVVGIIKKYSYPDGPISAHTTADEIFTLIHKWLDKDLEDEGFCLGGMIRSEIRARFLPFVINEAER